MWDHGRVPKFPLSGHQSVLGNAARSFFEGLATDTAGNVYAVALEDTSPDFAGIIYKFAPDGTRTVFGTTPGQTFGLAFDGAGNLYAADAVDVTIYKFAPDGTRTVFVGPSAFTSTQLPAGLAFDSSGNLFVSTLGNRPNDAILVFTPTGMESTFATDLNNPHGMAFDAAGNLFVAETIRDGGGDILSLPRKARGSFSVQVDPRRNISPLGLRDNAITRARHARKQASQTSAGSGQNRF